MILSISSGSIDILHLSQNIMEDLLLLYSSSLPIVPSNYVLYFLRFSFVLLTFPNGNQLFSSGLQLLEVYDILDLLSDCEKMSKNLKFSQNLK